MCLHPSGQKCASVPFATPQAERKGGWGEGGAEARSLQLCPYSQHLTKSPDVHTGNSNNLSNVSPLWDPGTCKCNLTIQHDGVITGLTSLHLERTHLIYQIKSGLDWGTIQKWYCILSISSAHQTKATQGLALTQLAIQYRRLQATPSSFTLQHRSTFISFTSLLRITTIG